MTDADYADYLAFLPNTPDQAESFMHSPEQAAGGIVLYVNANKKEFMCFKKEWTIFTPRGKPIELVNQFTNLGSNIPSTESDISIRLACNAIDRLSIIWKSYLSDKIKRYIYIYIYTLGIQWVSRLFFALAFKIVLDSWKFSMLLVYMLWDDWPIFMISASNEQL